MGLTVETPDPPELQEVDPNEYDDTEVAGETDYRREEIESFLRDGAWERAFEEWAGDTDMDEGGFAIVTDLGLIEQFDFFWDSYAERVGYHAPGIPEDWKEREYHPDIDSWEVASSRRARRRRHRRGLHPKRRRSGRPRAGRNCQRTRVCRGPRRPRRTRRSRRVPRRRTQRCPRGAP